MEIIAINPIATSGTTKVVEEYRDELKNRFRQDFIDRIEMLSDALPDFAIEDFREVEAFIELGKGGIFAGLWDLGELLDTGLYINLKAIPINQEIIEIANYLDFNPYEIESDGAYLLAAKSGYELNEKINSKGYISVIIGHTTDSKDRIIRNGEFVRYIEKNRGKDELERMIRHE